MAEELRTITVDVKDGVTHITFRYPELDIAEVPQIDEELRSAIEAADTTRFVLDLTGVRYMPTVGLGMLMSILIKIRKEGGEFRLASLCADLKGLLTMVRLDTVFEIYDDVDEALASFD
jgi:anti-sigma B factor antagonist